MGAEHDATPGQVALAWLLAHPADIIPLVGSANPDHIREAAGGLWLGTCFCDRCVEGFRTYLKGLPAAERARLGVADPDTFDFRAAAREWLAADPAGKRNVTGHPLWPHLVQRGSSAVRVQPSALASSEGGGISPSLPAGPTSGAAVPSRPGLPEVPRQRRRRLRAAVGGRRRPAHLEDGSPL